MSPLQRVAKNPAFFLDPVRGHGVRSQVVMYGNQRLAVLANPLFSHIKAQIRLSQSVLVANAH